jgi:PEGA domain
MPSRSRLAEDRSPGRFSPERVERGRSDGASKPGWLVRLLRRSGARPRPAPAAAPPFNPLLEFASETGVVETAHTHMAAPKRRLPTPRWLVPAAACGIVIAAGALAFRPIQRRFQAGGAAPRVATLSLETRPAGAEVLIDGRRLGESPLTLTMTAGTHTMTLRHGRDQRTMPLTLTAGAVVTQYLEFAPSESPVAQTGRISIITDPPGARVKVDGDPRGISPVVVTALSAANHLVTVTGATGTAERTIPVQGGETTAVVFSLPRLPAASSTLSAPVGGWLAVVSPFELQVVERDEVVGTSGATRIMLPSGRHDVDLVNQTLDYREGRTIQVAPGKLTTLRIDAPKGTLNANARPWADVLIDGNNVGQTPIANLTIPIGTHQVVFRHPQLGERRQTIVVTVKGPNRIAMDLSK